MSYSAILKCVHCGRSIVFKRVEDKKTAFNVYNKRPTTKRHYCRKYKAEDIPAKDYEFQKRLDEIRKRKGLKKNPL